MHMLAVLKLRADHAQLESARPIACLVHAAVAPRCAVQEVDPRFSRLAALALANQMAREPSGDGSRSSQGHTANAQLGGGHGKKNGKANFPTPGNQCAGRPATLVGGECGPPVFWLPAFSAR